MFQSHNSTGIPKFVNANRLNQNSTATFNTLIFKCKKMEIYFTFSFQISKVSLLFTTYFYGFKNLKIFEKKEEKADL